MRLAPVRPPLGSFAAVASVFVQAGPLLRHAVSIDQVADALILGFPCILAVAPCLELSNSDGDIGKDAESFARVGFGVMVAATEIDADTDLQRVTGGE